MAISPWRGEGRWGLGYFHTRRTCLLKPFVLDLKVSPFKWGWELLRNFDLWDHRYSFTYVPQGGLSYYGRKGSVGILFKNSSSVKYWSLSNCMAHLEVFPPDSKVLFSPDVHSCEVLVRPSRMGREDLNDSCWKWFMLQKVLCPSRTPKKIHGVRRKIISITR